MFVDTGARMTLQAVRNRRVVLRRRPTGIPTSEDFEIVDSPVQQPGLGEVLIRNEYLSVEPAMRGWVSAEANYSAPVPIGDTMRALSSGTVVESRDRRYAAGDVVTGWLGWQEYACVPAERIERRLDSKLPISTSLGVLGLNGLTAHIGLLRFGRPEAGQTVVVSTAAGAVGSCVGQIAKLKGCRTVGIAGGPVKARLCLEEFGFDVALDYKDEGFEAALAAACTSGVDIYFDNTAGAISDLVMEHLSLRARVVVCGTASISTWTPKPLGPRVERHLLVKRASMQGFVVLDHAQEHASALEELTAWVQQGRIRYREDITEGIETAPSAIESLYRGENLGKRLIRLQH